MSDSKARKLGRRQAEVLDLLKEHGTYVKKGDWIYNSHSETVEILESLVKRGDAKIERGEDDTIKWVFVPSETSVEVSPEAAHPEQATA